MLENPRTTIGGLVALALAIAIGFGGIDAGHAATIATAMAGLLAILSKDGRP